MARIINSQLAERIDTLHRQMLAQFEYLIREMHRIEDGRPRDGDRPRVNGPEEQPRR